MKKAQAYSLVVLLIAIPLMLFISYYITTTQTIKYGLSDKIIADQQQQVSKSMEKDFARAIDIAARRGMMSMSNDIIENGAFLDNTAALLIELMENGTINGKYAFIMQNNRLVDWRDSILSIDTGFDVYLNHSNLKVYNYDGLRINSSVNLILNVSDGYVTSHIAKSMFKEVLVSVDGLEDPTYSIQTSGRVTRVVDTYPYLYTAEKIVSGNGNPDCTGNVTFNSSQPNANKILVTDDASGISGFLGIVAEASNLPDPSVVCYLVNAQDAVSKINSTLSRSNYTFIYLDKQTNAAWSLPVKEAIESGYYMNFSTSGPDFFQRLEGNLSDIGNGMESIVNIPELSGAGVVIKEDESCVDYLYFSSQNYIGYAVRGLPSWFRLDESSAAKYNLTELLET